MPLLDSTVSSPQSVRRRVSGSSVHTESLKRNWKKMKQAGEKKFVISVFLAMKLLHFIRSIYYRPHLIHIESIEPLARRNGVEPIFDIR